MRSLDVQRFFHHLHFVFLPLLLALLFALQNQIFNEWLHLFSSQYSTRLLFASFALGLIIYSPSLFFNKRGRYVYLFSASFFVSLIFLGQFLFFEYGQSFLQISALRYIGQASSVAGTIATFISFKLIMFIANILVVGIAFALTYKENYLEVILSQKEKIVLFVILLLVAFAGYYFLVREEKKEWGNSSRLYKDIYDLNTLVEKIGIVNFTLEDTFKYIARSNLVTPKDKGFLQNFAKNQKITESLPAGEKKPNYFGIAKGKNIIFLQIESLENAVINRTVSGQSALSGAEGEITPNLNALAGQGLYFSNYYTQVGPGNTADAEFSTLNSLYPLPDDVAFVDYAQNQYHALPQVLVKNGYHTYALHGDVPTFWNRSNIYPNLGYQNQISESGYTMTRPVGHGPSPLGDEDFLTQSLPKMQGFQQPFMATLITISSHTPFELPQDLQTLQISQDTTLNYTQQQYLESIHYADNAVGEFIDGLKKSGLYNNSVIFIYGDHESFTNINEALDAGQDARATRVAGAPVSDKNLPALSGSQVPLIILNSGIKNSEITIPASHLDLYPTILNLLGQKSLPGLLGQDVFNTKNPVVTRRNIFSGTINTILTNTLAFKANADGVFESGECLKIPEETSLPVKDCKDLYDQQSSTVKASDIIVRGNLLGFYVSNLPK